MNSSTAPLRKLRGVLLQVACYEIQMRRLEQVADWSKLLLHPEPDSHERRVQACAHLLLQEPSKLAVIAVLQYSQNYKNHCQAAPEQVPACIFRDSQSEHK